MQPHHRHPHHAHRHGRAARFLSHPLVAGFLSLAWLVLRAGRKPTRLAYPCQQAALSGVSIAFSLSLVPATVRLVRWVAARRVRIVATSAMFAALLFGGLRDAALGQTRGGVTHARADYYAHVYDVDQAHGMNGDHHVGVDALLRTMGANGLRIFRSAAVGPLAGPDGIVGANDVVLIKVNQQWPERGGTNTDVLRGLIAALLAHPDGFHGEIVVVENGQGVGSFAWPSSNADDPSQTTNVVVQHYIALGQPVSALLWDGLKDTRVAEYSTGDTTSGYVVGAWDDATQLAVSYPKFRTPGGNLVSLKQGVWNPATQQYDASRLKFITLPVLKCHQSYGVTGAVKVHLGTMTTGLSTNAHNSVWYGGNGRFLGLVRMPDLNLLDCTYVLAQPGEGPACTYGMATRLDHLVASQDPVALDLWAVQHLLVPAIVANGYTSWPMQDPTNASGDFRHYLDLSAAQLAAAGVSVTEDAAHIVAVQSHTTDMTLAPLAPRAGAFPNPFVEQTVIELLPPRTGTVQLDVFDVSGRLRRSIATPVRAGIVRDLAWDGRDDAGRRLGAGTYFWRTSGAGATQSGRVTLLK